MDTSIKILCADDFVTMRRILKQLGFSNITEADDGIMALDELKKGRFDLIISGWNMPEMSDLEFLKTVRGMEDYKEIPFFDDHGRSAEVKCCRPGFPNYVVRPFTAESISEKILA